MELVGTSVIDGYLVQVFSEGTGNKMDVTQQPVEEGLSLTDHVERKPQVISLSGLLIRPTKERVERLINQLELRMRNGTVITYEGRRIYTNMVIESFDYDADASIGNGYTFSMTLIEVRMAKPSYVKETKPVTTSGSKQTANKNTGPIMHVIKKGETYWAISPKYGTTWQAVQALNPGVDPRKLQIGQKVRIK